MHALVIRLCAVPFIAVPAVASPAVELPALVVTANRAAEDPARLALTVDRFEAGRLLEGPALALDDALRASPAFGLFRRTSSVHANPTAQGVSLRGIGPSGASRSLVLLDGVPLNDPFGGWVAWSRAPRLGLRAAEIVRGGGSGVWGGAALGGVVQLLGAAPEAGSGALALELGDRRTGRAEFLAATALGEEGVLHAGGRLFATSGFLQYGPAQRGAVDRPLDSDHSLAHAGYTRALAGGLRLAAAASAFEETRGNGTPYTGNRSSEQAGRVRLSGELRPGLVLEAGVHAQRQRFSSRFSTVAPGRATETPALDQFAVPAVAWGGSVVVTAAQRDDASTTVGADLRHVRGETREDFLFVGGGFTRRRIAGGAQTFGGIFAAHRRELGGRWSAHVGARLDGWRLDDGRRRETVLATGAPVRVDAFVDREGLEASPSVGLVWRARDGVRLRGAAYRAFRVPTLNEFHRPFRVGNVATEANPDLANETLDGAELALDLERGAWSLSVGTFAARLEDAVANVTLTSTPTLVTRQRRNLGRVDVRGLETSLRWRRGESFELRLAHQLVDARVEAAPLAPALVGRRLAQVPRHVATLGATIRPAARWRLEGGARFMSGQFEDDENRLRLDGAITVDLAVAWAFAPGRELSLAVENLFDTRVETGRTSDGLVALAAPRLARAGLSARW